jgi:hypothetical protein
MNGQQAHLSFNAIPWRRFRRLLARLTWIQDPYRIPPSLDWGYSLLHEVLATGLQVP